MPIKLSIYRAAIEFGLEHRTVSKRLVAAGFPVHKGAKFNIGQLSKALITPLEKARIREITARAVKRERQNDEADACFLPAKDAADFKRRILGIIRRHLESLPAALAAKTNPSDPAFAQAALGEWVSETMKLLRE